MDPGSNTSSAPDLFTSAASMQLASLAAAIGGVLLGVLLITAGTGWMTRRRRRAEIGSRHGVMLSHDSTDDSAGDSREIATSLRLATASMLAVVLLPAAAAIRQLWPHPDLGWVMVASWFGVLLPVVVIWLVLGRSFMAGSSTRRPRE